MDQSDLTVNRVSARNAVRLGFAVRRRLRPTGSRCAATAQERVRGDVVEVGGPSAVFAADGLLGLYPGIDRLDNCNFSSETMWEGTLREGEGFRFRSDCDPAHQWIAEAFDLPMFAKASRDALISSHMLEHSANPLRVLHEWARVLRPGGTLVLVLPHRDGFFDWRRPVTEVQHMLGDFRAGVTESDPTHVDEVVRLHDLGRDSHCPSVEELTCRLQRNGTVRGMHHHVFTEKNLCGLVAQAPFRILASEVVNRQHIVVVAERLA